MAIQRRGTASDLPGDLGGRHGAGRQHRLCSPDLDSSSAAGRPPRRPRPAAATRPARVRSTMISRSMELSAPRMLNMNRPLGVVVSMLSVIDLSATPRRFRSSAMSIRCRRLRASRSGRSAIRTISCTGQSRASRFAYSAEPCLPTSCPGKPIGPYRPRIMWGRWVSGAA